MNSLLCQENIDKSTDTIEYHPLHPFLPPQARILFLGSFPPPRKRWCMDFFYPNFINDYWRIQGAIFHNDPNHFVNTAKKTFRIGDIVEHCTRHGLALYDTCTAVRRLQANASDKFLEVLVPTDIHALMKQLPQLKAIATTGEKATQIICQQLGLDSPPKLNNAVNIPDTTIMLYRLPSSSRAYPLAFEQKKRAYETFLFNYLK